MLQSNDLVLGGFLIIFVTLLVIIFCWLVMTNPETVLDGVQNQETLEKLVDNNMHLQVVHKKFLEI